MNETAKKSIILKKEPYKGLLTGAVLIKKEVFDIIGGFDEGLKHVEGMELQIRFQKYNIKMCQLDIVSTDRRIHNSNTGRTNRRKQFINQAAILRAKLVLS
jgi:hypothetical protein